MKTQGLCAVSGEPCFEILATHQDGPFAGEPSKLGKPHDDALKVTLVMVDGSQMHITVREDSLPELKLSVLWREIMERVEHESSNRRALGHKHLTEEQQRIFQVTNLKFYDNRPLGVLAVERWQDVGTG